LLAAAIVQRRDRVGGMCSVVPERLAPLSETLLSFLGDGPS
jgi:hypothetical protein